eukprot:851073-Amphidinium_carterae.1
MYWINLSSVKSVVEVNVDLGVDVDDVDKLEFADSKQLPYVEDVDKRELAFVDELEDVDELELIKENVVEVDVDVGVDVEDVDKPELVLVDVLEDVVEQSAQNMPKSITS